MIQGKISEKLTLTIRKLFVNLTKKYYKHQGEKLCSLL